MEAVKALGSIPTRTSFRSPWQNGIAERWVGSCRRDLLDPAGDRSLGNIKTQHEKLSMDARRSPRRILDDRLEDQPPNLLRGLSSPDRLPDFGDHPPIQMETSPVPADDRFWCNDDEGVFPSRPRSTDDNPE